MTSPVANASLADPAEMAASSSSKPTTTTPPRRNNSRRPQASRKNPSSSENNSNSKNNKQNILTSEEKRRLLMVNSSILLLHPHVTLTCYIPSNAVGAVIGRRGSTIVQIQKHAQQYCSSKTSSPAPTSSSSPPPPPVRVSIVAETETDVPYTYSPLDWSSSLWTPVVIRAEPAAALAAAERLEEILRSEIASDNKKDSPLQQDTLMDDVVLDVSLSRTKHHATLVGKKGLNLMNLSADHRTRIMVPRKDLRHDVVQFEGSLVDVSECFQQALQFLVNAEQKKKKQQHGTPDGVSKVTSKIAVTVLPPQTKLRSVARKTDTAIQKQKSEDGSGWELVITGVSTMAAVEMMEKWNTDQASKKADVKGEGSSNNKTTAPRTRRGARAGNKNKRSTTDGMNTATTVTEVSASMAESTPLIGAETTTAAPSPPLEPSAPSP